ncbi:MAG TPA: DNA polymerase IV [Clostridia bacterium]|nr:DNA polymerase IV [Clostridia bacterium]
MFFHVDVNSAYLSWEASYRLMQGESLDLRSIPSAIGGNPRERKGIILAKSIPAKAYGIQTGETLVSALGKCPSLTIVAPNFSLYKKCSRALSQLLESYSPKVQAFSIDESFMDMGSIDDPLALAEKLREEIEETLGFTVNIGLGPNKLLAKMASDFKKPNRVHSLFYEEIPHKMWPLPVGELFMVGKKTREKLLLMGIETIGDLASANPDLLYSRMKSHGLLIHKYAQGKEFSPIESYSPFEAKGVGNSTTLPRDINDAELIELYLLGISEMVSFRLRSIDKMAYVLSLHYRDNNFKTRRVQRKLLAPLDATSSIYKQAKILFYELWKEEPLRQLGLSLSELVGNQYYEQSFLDQDQEKLRKVDATIDNLRKKYGRQIIQRASFLYTPVDPMIGGVGEDKDELILSSKL